MRVYILLILVLLFYRQASWIAYVERDRIVITRSDSLNIFTFIVLHLYVPLQKYTANNSQPFFTLSVGFDSKTAAE